MKTTNSYGIYFTIRPDKMKDGKAPVYVCAGKDSRIRTNKRDAAGREKTGIGFYSNRLV